MAPDFQGISAIKIFTSKSLPGREFSRPVFRCADACAAAQGPPLITIPGLGCGQFAGPFRGWLGAELQAVLERFLAKHGTPRFPNRFEVRQQASGSSRARSSPPHAADQRIAFRSSSTSVILQRKMGTTDYTDYTDYVYVMSP